MPPETRPETGIETKLVFAGQLRRQYLLPPEGRPLLDVPAGNLLYAASGACLWTSQAALLARVGEDYPHHWLHQFEEKGMDPQGIKILPEPMDLRSFIAFTDPNSFQTSNPVSHFARLGMAFPKSLLGYQPPAADVDSRILANPDSPKISDIPSDYLSAKAVHLCPLDYLAHSQLAPAFRQGGVATVVLDPGPGYMNGNFLNDMRSLLQGISAFLPSEEEIRTLFWGRTTDLWEMAETLGSYGVEMVVIKRGARGQYVYDRDGHKKWDVPAYPARLVNPLGAGDAFGGGFLAGYVNSFNALQAALYGNVSASLAIEGSGAFYALEALPGLAQARLQSLADIVRLV
jgi:sugar/nucleoside kinase (ribokinase family)